MLKIGKCVVVEHRPIRREAVTIRLPMPPSVNNLYATVGRARIPTERYKIWKNDAGNTIVQIGRPHISGPVEISMTFEEPNRLSDLDNRAKAPLDLLVSMRVIDGDHSAIVRKLTLAWGSEKGALIRIIPASEFAPRKRKNWPEASPP